MCKCVQFGLLIIFYLSSTTTVIYAARATTCEVEYTNGKLSIKAEKIVLRHLLVKLHEKTGLAFLCEKKVASKKVSVKLQKLSIEAAIKRIFGSMNYVSLMSDDMRITKIIIFGESDRAIFTERAKAICDNLRPNRVIRNDPTDESLMKVHYQPLPMKVFSTEDSEMKISHDHGKMVIRPLKSEEMQIVYHPIPMDIVRP